MNRTNVRSRKIQFQQDCYKIKPFTAELSRAEDLLVELYTHATMPVIFHGHG